MSTVAAMATDPEGWPRDGAGKILPGRFRRMQVSLRRSPKTASGPATRPSPGADPFTVEVEGTVDPRGGTWEITLHLSLRLPKAE